MAIKVSKGHYEVTSVDVLGSLNPIATFLEFDEILNASVPDPATINLGRLYFSEDTNRLVYRRRNDGDTAWVTTDLEGGGGGGTSFIGFTADADLNMGAFNILSTVAPATNILRIIFDGDADSDTYFSNSTTDTDRINVFNNNINTVAYTEIFTSILNDLLMNTGKITATTGQNLRLDTIDAGGEIELLKPVIMGAGFVPNNGQLRFSNAESITFSSFDGLSTLAFRVLTDDTFNFAWSNNDHYKFSITELDVTGANVVNSGNLVDFASLQTLTGHKTLEDISVTDPNPVFVTGSILKTFVEGTAVNLDDVQTITAEKAFDSLVITNTGTGFVCLDTTPSFVSGSINANAITDNTMGLDPFIHQTGGYLITYNGSGVPSYLIAGTSGKVLTSNGNGNSLSWETPSGGGEVNTASNVGTGVGKQWKNKVGVDLRFKSNLEGFGIDIVDGTDDVQFNLGSPTWTTGQIPYASSPSVLSQLTIGASNTVLKVVGGVPTWSSIDNNSLASGAFANIVGIGTQNQALNMNNNEIQTAGNITLTISGTAVTTSEVGFYHTGVNLIAQVPTSDGFLWKVNTAQVFGLSTSGVNFATHKGINCVDPTANQDVATKKYVDDNAGSLDGTLEFSRVTAHETTQFDFFTWHNNTRQGTPNSVTDAIIVEDVVHYVPFWLGQELDIERMAVEVEAVTGGYQTSFAVYSNRTDGQNYPATKIGDVTTSASGTGIKTGFISTVAISAGLIWLAFACFNNNTVDTTGAFAEQCNSSGYKQNASSFDPILVYIESATSMPTTPDDEMIVITDKAPMIFARFRPA